MEVGRRLLEGLDRDRHPDQGRFGVGEDVLAGRADGLAECLCVVGVAQAREYLVFVRVGHFVRVEERHQRLVVPRVDAAVPGAPAGRSLIVLATGRLDLVEVLGEGDRRVQIA